MSSLHFPKAWSADTHLGVCRADSPGWMNQLLPCGNNWTDGKWSSCLYPSRTKNQEIRDLQKQLEYLWNTLAENDRKIYICSATAHPGRCCCRDVGATHGSVPAWGIWILLLGWHRDICGMSSTWIRCEMFLFRPGLVWGG